MATATIYFTKLFTNGLLRGLSVLDRISFPDDAKHRASYAKAFAVGVERCGYRITDASFQNYAR